MCWQGKLHLQGSYMELSMSHWASPSSSDGHAAMMILWPMHRNFHAVVCHGDVVCANGIAMQPPTAAFLHQVLLEMRGPLRGHNTLRHLQSMRPPLNAGLHAGVAADVAAEQAAATVMAPASSNQQSAEQAMAMVPRASQPSHAADVLKVSPVPSCMAAARGLTTDHAILGLSCLCMLIP